MKSFFPWKRQVMTLLDGCDFLFTDKFQLLRYFTEGCWRKRRMGGRLEWRLCLQQGGKAYNQMDFWPLPKAFVLIVVKYSK
ncbi:MAG: hypothetical protein P8X63_04645 [Desulfuromonadaceae bacterium]